MKTQQLEPAKLPPVPSLLDLGRSPAGALNPSRTVAQLDGDLQNMLRGVDLTNIKPSQLRGIAMKLFEQGRISEDVASEFLLARRAGTDKRSDDRPFNLIENMRQGLKRSGAIMQRYPFAETARWYEEAGASARGVNEVIAFLRKHPRLDVRA